MTQRGISSHNLRRRALLLPYNAENQMTSTAGVTYTYDGDGKRVQKSSGKLYWYGLGSDPLDETDGAGATNNASFNEYIFFDGKRIARRDSTNAVNYYFADHLGTARTVANATGAILDDSDFYPFGGERAAIAPTSGNNYKFTGKERDTESTLDYFGTRHYGSNMGRFVSPDPLLSTLRPENPQTLNRYTYTLNSPLRYVDPTGAYEEDVHQQLTTVLAQAAGFDEKTAGEIGRADQGVDEDSKTGPFASAEARRDYHFTTEERRTDLWNAFDASGSTEDLGTYLHAEQDSFAHEGYGPRMGHLSAGHAPDKTYNDPAKADRMAKDTYGKLTAAADRLGINSSNRVAFAKIDKLVSAFNKAKTTEDKNKILGQIRDTIKQVQREQVRKKVKP
jgi:RHS repeat-associated protein